MDDDPSTTVAPATNDWPDIIGEILCEPKAHKQCLTEANFERYNNYLAHDASLSDEVMEIWSRHVVDCESCQEKFKSLPNLQEIQIDPVELELSSFESEFQAMRYYVFA